MDSQDARVQAKDIPDEVFMRAVLAAMERKAAEGWGSGRGVVFSTGHYDGSPWVMRGEVSEELERVTGIKWPWKVELAKFRQLEKRKLLDGCSCGCRGDIQITVKGAECLDLGV